MRDVMIIDPEVLEYDGRGFRVIIKDPEAHDEKLKAIRERIVADILKRKAEDK
jgi:hypothetical protein